MSVKIGRSSCRSDTKKFAKCGDKFYQYCLSFRYSCPDYWCAEKVNLK